MMNMIMLWFITMMKRRLRCDDNDADDDQEKGDDDHDTDDDHDK
jgi:hypothetical protein